MKLLGANWKTTVSGIGAALFSLLTILAALPYEAGGIADIVNVEWKHKILLVSIGAALLLKVWNSIQQKDRTVTGGSVQQTLGGSVAQPGSQTLVDATKKSSPADEQHIATEAVPPKT